MPPGRGETRCPEAPHAPSQPISCSWSSLRWGTLRDRRGQRTPAALGDREAPGRHSGGSLDGSCSRALTSQGPRPASDVHPHSLPSSHQLPGEVLRAPGAWRGGHGGWTPSMASLPGSLGVTPVRLWQAARTGLSLRQRPGGPQCCRPLPRPGRTEGSLTHSPTHARPGTCQSPAVPQQQGSSGRDCGECSTPGPGLPGPWSPSSLHFLICKAPDEDPLSARLPAAVCSTMSRPMSRPGTRRPGYAPITARISV